MSAQLDFDSLTVDKLADAVAWARRNEAAYAAIVEWAHQDMAHSSRPSIDLYVNLLRHPHFAHKLGLRRTDSVYLVNNTLRSKLARLVMREHPAIEFETRRSDAD